MTGRSHILKADRTVLIYHGICLKEADGKNFLPKINFISWNFKLLVEILRGPRWLNDQLIAFYFQYLESEAYRSFSHDFLFVSPQVTQLLKMIDSRIEDARDLLDPLHPYTKKFIFFPVNDNDRDREGGTHWSLLVFSKPENTFYTFDSANNQNNYATTKIVEVLRRVLNCQLAFSIYYPSTQQSNYHDCGIFVICNVENIIKHILRGTGVVRDVAVLDRDVVSRKRRELLDLIQALGGRIWRRLLVKI